MSLLCVGGYSQLQHNIANQRHRATHWIVGTYDIQVSPGPRTRSTLHAVAKSSYSDQMLGERVAQHSERHILCKDCCRKCLWYLVVPSVCQHLQHYRWLCLKAWKCHSRTDVIQYVKNRREAIFGVYKHCYCLTIAF